MSGYHFVSTKVYKSAYVMELIDKVQDIQEEQ
jgi:hypothetical protein